MSSNRENRVFCVRSVGSRDLIGNRLRVSARVAMMCALKIDSYVGEPDIDLGNRAWLLTWRSRQRRRSIQEGPMLILKSIESQDRVILQNDNVVGGRIDKFT